MHIPDGFLDTKTWVSLSVISGTALAYGSRRARERMGDRHVPVMGVMSAFIFAAQMVNVPVAGGTSGHFMGGVLAAAVLGPWSGMLVMAAVLAVQCLLFQDGGLTALGANIFNMGFVGAGGGYVVFRGLQALTAQETVAAFGAGWASIVLAAAACAVELAVSGMAPLPLVLPAMVGIHAVIGVGEGLITAAVVALLQRVRPDILALNKV